MNANNSVFVQPIKDKNNNKKREKTKKPEDEKKQPKETLNTPIIQTEKCDVINCVT